MELQIADGLAGPSTVLDLLPRFNRKERFFVVGFALGNSEFRLGDLVRAEISRHFDNIEIPENAFAAMDYHLDWLHAVLWASRGRHEDAVNDRNPQQIAGNQEDIDLLIAFEASDITHLILLEAKAATGYTNAQFKSKVRRLTAIFDGHEEWSPRVAPHFAVMSPRPPRKLNLDGGDDWTVPGWMLDTVETAKVLKWIELPINHGLLKVTRCTPDGQPSEKGSFWRIVPG